MKYRGYSKDEIAAFKLIDHFRAESVCEVFGCEAEAERVLLVENHNGMIAPFMLCADHLDKIYELFHAKDQSLRSFSI